MKTIIHSCISGPGERLTVIGCELNKQGLKGKASGVNSQRIIVIIISMLFLILSCQQIRSQAGAGLNLGGGYGSITHKFIRTGEKLSFIYPSPGLYLSGELDYRHFLMDMSLALLISSGSATLGSSPVDLTGYKGSLGMDFMVGGGYLYPVSDKLQAGGIVGFHVSSFTITPADETDTGKLRFGGNYGLIGIGLEPRLRYVLSEKVRLSLSIPVGIDLGPMSEDVVAGGVTVGRSAAIVQPASLIPEFKGFSWGVYLSAGYFFNFN
jgi:hypothetical protein